MNQHYPDLIDKLGEPLWWDERGVPRYLPFHPSLCNDIYAKEAVLFRICCQTCGREFNVADTWSEMDMVMNPHAVSLRNRVDDRSLHYGDPPNIGCCEAGPTMNCEDLDVLEFWQRHEAQYICNGHITDDRYFNWARLPELEVKLMDKPVLT